MTVLAIFSRAIYNFLRTVVSKGNFRKSLNASSPTPLDPAGRYRALNCKMRKTKLGAAITSEQAMEQAEWYWQMADEYQRLADELAILNLSDPLLDFTIENIQRRRNGALLLASSRLRLALRFYVSKPVVK